MRSNGTTFDTQAIQGAFDTAAATHDILKSLSQCGAMDPARKLDLETLASLRGWHGIAQFVDDLHTFRGLGRYDPHTIAVFVGLPSNGELCEQALRGRGREHTYFRAAYQDGLPFEQVLQACGENPGAGSNVLHRTANTIRERLFGEIASVARNFLSPIFSGQIPDRLRTHEETVAWGDALSVHIDYIVPVIADRHGLADLDDIQVHAVRRGIGAAWDAGERLREALEEAGEVQKGDLVSLLYNIRR